jgi:hypothetical protein
MKQVIILLALLSLVFSQCTKNTNCADCIADKSCTYCALSSPGGGGACTDSGTACQSFYTGPNVTNGGNCPTSCGEAANCGVCNNAQYSAAGCVWCNFTSNGFQTCSHNSTCGFVGNNITAANCPATCQVAPQPNASYTGATCVLPANTMIPVQTATFALCNQNALGIGAPEPGNTTSNCSDNCTSQGANVGQDCLDLLHQYQCNAFCPTCDSGYGLSYYSRYLPCQSVCDNLVKTCNKYLTGSCQLSNASLTCSSHPNCTNYAATLQKVPVDSCKATSSSSASTSSSVPSTSTVSSSGSSSQSASNSASSSASSSASKSSSGASSSASASKSSSGVSSSATPAPTPTPSTTGDSSRVLFAFGLLLISFLFN